jgi:hypothetical protein
MQGPGAAGARRLRLPVTMDLVRSVKDHHQTWLWVADHATRVGRLATVNGGDPQRRDKEHGVYHRTARAVLSRIRVHDSSRAPSTRTYRPGRLAADACSR